MARLRNEWGQTVDDVDFGLSLSENLDRLGVVLQADTEQPHKKKWFVDNSYLGSFDAREGWIVLRHYNMSGSWHHAHLDALVEIGDGYA